MESTGKTVPFVKSRPVLGLLPEFRKEKLHLAEKLMAEHGDIFAYKLGPYTIILISQPEYIRHVLQENYTNYKKDYFYEDLKLALGRGLVTSEGDFWRQQRKLAQPAFHRAQIERFSQTMVDQTLALVERWNAAPEGSATVDLVDEMKRLTMSIVGLTLFSSDVSSEAISLGHAINGVLTYLNHRMELLVKLPASFPTRRNLQFRRDYDVVKERVLRMITDRRTHGAEGGDLLDMLLTAQDEETGVGMSDRQLLDEVMTLFMAGHETTAHTLVWTFYLLHHHPHVESRLHDELDEVLGGEPPTIGNLQDLTYTDMVIRESMRYLPAVWGIGREALEDDELDGYSVPAGTTVFIPIYNMHRHPAYWDDPDSFQPERFADPRMEKSKRWIYMPFGGGPRQCIGNSFALMEAKLALAAIAQRFHVRLESEAEIEFDPGVTLRPKGLMAVHLVPRT